MEEFQQSFEDIVMKVDSMKKQMEKNPINSGQTEFSNPPKSQFPSNYVVFTSSKDDQASVDIICKNLDEFTPICKENGFNLVVQQEADNGVVIRLIQSSATFNSRKAFKELDELVKRKSDRDEQMEVRFQKLIEEMSEKLESKYNSLIEKQAKQLEIMSKELSDLRQSATKTPVDRLLDEHNLDTVRESPEILEKLCENLSEDVKDVELKPPFQQIETMEEKKKILLEYLDFLQIKANPTDMQIEISNFIQDVRQKYFWNLTEEEKKDAVDRNKDKYQLENVVGTIQKLPFYRNKQAYAMYLAIVDQKIVDFVFDSAGFDVILRRLYNYLKTRYGSLKFATEFTIEDTYSDVFVEFKNNDVFLQDRKVITWMRNNFKSWMEELKTGSDHYVFPALYNLSLRHIQQL